MYSFEERIDIAATPARVWRALCEPAEVVEWDTGVEAALDAPADYPQPGQHVRWRYTNGPHRVLHDRPQEVVPERTLRSLIDLGPMRMDERYTLVARGGGAELTAALALRVAWPVIGPIAARFVYGPASRRSVAASLRAIKRHCESG